MSIGSFLEEIAKAKKLVTYQEVVDRFQLPPLQGNWNSHPLSQAFEALDQEDASKQRPFRTAVVVRKDKSNQMPGNGFFEALERLKSVPCRNAIDRQKVWVSELNSAHAFNWP